MPGRTVDYSAIYYQYIATNSVTINLNTSTSGPKTVMGSNANVEGYPCRALIPLGAAGGTCTLAVTRQDGTQISIANAGYGSELPIQAKKILPASNYTGILVLW